MWVLLLVSMWMGLAGAQSYSSPPNLSAEQKLQLQVLAQKMEIAQLKAQAAQRDFDAARDALMHLVQSLQVEGYVLDLATLTYRKQETDATKK